MEPLFQASMLRYLNRFFSAEYLRKLELALKTPGSRYFLRVNTLLADPEDVAARLREEGVEVYRHQSIHEALFVPISGPFSVSMHKGKVVVDWKTAESAYVGAHVYAPGVQKIINAEKGELVSVVTPTDLPVAEGVLEMEPSEVFSERRGLAVRVTTSVYRVPSLREHPLFRDGTLYHQSLPSIVAVKLLSPKPGWTVLDMCASPGGKATHAAILMEDSGELIAVDRSESKVRALEENVKRLRLKSVRTLVYDSRYISELLGPNSVDAVILDPPCSSLGVRPKLRYTRGEGDVLRLANYQRQFLSEAAKVLRRGGLLLYTTCTLTPHENELNILFATKLGFRPVKIQPPLAVRAPMLGVAGAVFDPLYNDTPGFFVSLLSRV